MRRDALSQVLVDLEQNQTNAISFEELTTILSSVSVQTQNQESQVAVLNITSDIREENEFIRKETLGIIISANMSKYQRKTKTYQKY